MNDSSEDKSGGSLGSLVNGSWQVTLPTSPQTLWFQCQAHALMGGKIEVVDYPTDHPDSYSVSVVTKDGRHNPSGSSLGYVNPGLGRVLGHPPLPESGYVNPRPE